MKPFFTNDQLQQLLRLTIGAHVELVSYKICNQHPDYAVLLVKLRRPSMKVAVKLAGPDAPLASPFDRTAMLHRLVSERTSIPMPEILGVNMSYQEWPWRYLIKTHIPGQDWAVVKQHLSPDELADAYGQIGNAVAQLHAIQFPAFGELSVDGSVLVDGPFPSALAAQAHRTIKDRRSRGLFFSVLDEHQQLFTAVCQPALCHEDLHQHNILFHRSKGKWKLATILDFDKAWAGHNEIDLARLEFWRGMASPDFWPPYLAIYPIDPQYSQRRPIYQYLWCLEYAQPTQQHFDDTRRLCTENGFPVPNRFD